MKPLGIQIIAEFHSCSVKRLLNDVKLLERVIKNGINKVGLKYEKIISNRFYPIGITSIAIISESHVAIHTYPETFHTSIDIFSCNPDSRVAHRLFEYFRTKLRPKRVGFIELLRGNSLELKQRSWILEFSPKGWNIRYHVKKRILSKRTKYQQIDIIDNENFGKMLFLDNDLQIAEKDAYIYNKTLVDPIREIRSPTVAILGGGDGGVLSELLKYAPLKVFLIEIDEVVIASVKKFLPGICKDAFDNSRVRVVIKEASKFLQQDKRQFDAIICDLTMNPEVFTNLDRVSYLNELFSNIKRCLKGRGIVSLQCCSEFDTETHNILKKILPKYFENIVFQKIFIPSFRESWIFAHNNVTLDKLKT